MAVNKPVGDNARKGAVKKRTQRKTAVMGKPAWTKRDKTSGEFIAVKKSAKNSRALGGRSDGLVDQTVGKAVSRTSALPRRLQPCDAPHYLARRSFDKEAPIVSKADMIWLGDVNMKKLSVPLAQYCRMVETGSPSVLT